MQKKRGTTQLDYATDPHLYFDFKTFIRSTQSHLWLPRSA